MQLTSCGKKRLYTHMSDFWFTYRNASFWKNALERFWGSGTHYHIRIAGPCKIPIKYTNKQSLERKSVGTGFPLVPIEKALNLCKSWNIDTIVDGLL